MLNIQEGQVYLDEPKNEYVIVTKSDRGRIFYAGSGFNGIREDEIFIEKFLPVDPADLEQDELRQLLALCADGTTAKVGVILEEV